MKILPFILLLLLSSPYCQAQEPPKAQSIPIEIYFSPKAGCTEAVVKEITAAQSSILVQA
jgi:hypothetical protein